MERPNAHTPARIMRARDVSNLDVRLETVRQARDVAHSVRWARMPDRAMVPTLLHHYAAHRIPYTADGNLQSIRRPAAIVGAGMTADCKSTAVFIGGLGAAAGCDVRLRFVEYAGTPWLSHVYAIIDGTACDPLQQFGAELPYIRAEDHPIRCA